MDHVFTSISRGCKIDATVIILYSQVRIYTYLIHLAFFAEIGKIYFLDSIIARQMFVLILIFFI